MSLLLVAAHLMTLEDTADDEFKVMTRPNFLRIETRCHQPPTCERCGKLIRVDQWYRSKSTNYSTKRHHKDCLVRY